MQGDSLAETLQLATAFILFLALTKSVEMPTGFLWPSSWTRATSCHSNGHWAAWTKRVNGDR